MIVRSRANGTAKGPTRQQGLRHFRRAAPEPFVWTATADEILAKVRLVQANIKKLLDNNAK